MGRYILRLAAVGSLALFGVDPLVEMTNREVGSPELVTGLGDVHTLLAAYRKWEAQYARNGGDRNLVLALGWFKGLSAEPFTRARGTARLDLVDGRVTVEVGGLEPQTEWDVWLIDNRPSPGGSVRPEPGDAMLRIGRLEARGERSTLKVRPGPEALRGFDVELVAVTRADRNPADECVLVGTMSLFHRLYRSARRGRFGDLEDADGSFAVAPARGGANLVSAAQANELPSALQGMEALIARGRNVFFNERFNGNGRTCGTCHRENNNLTIDAEFISALPADDALFVAEFTPALSQHFENPVLMRTLGLILENVDGFDPSNRNKFVMRGVPHTLALPTSITPPAFLFDGTTLPPNQRTGWGGDGAPGTGTLKEFAIGAVKQHFTRTLNRVAGVDFRLPTTEELEAMEAFQLSTGRQSDLNLDPIAFRDPRVARGKVLFNDQTPTGGKCSLCHLKAGATADGSGNANFNTGVEDQPDLPATLVGPQPPRDGGFGPVPVQPETAFGNGTFSTPPVVEAADTVPGFHNNSAATVEGLVAFYNSQAFKDSPGGRFLAGNPTIGPINLGSTQVEAVAAFMRVINALENTRSSTQLGNRARNAQTRAAAREPIELSISEIGDADEVLAGQSLHPDARRRLKRAAVLLAAAALLENRTARSQLIDQALEQLAAARNLMIE